MADFSELLEWTAYVPFWIGVYRWGVYFFLRVLPSLFYRPYRYKKPTPQQIAAGTSFDTTDVTVIVPVLEPPPDFEVTIQTVLANKPGRIIVYADKKKGLKKVREICAKYPSVEVYPESDPGKRPALIRGIEATNTKLVALVDDDVAWSNTFLENIVAPFQHNAKIGGVGCKQVARMKYCCDVWNVMADMRLAVRFLELMATTVLDKGAACISGRTGVYQTAALKTPGFRKYFMEESFCGLRGLSGDDKCVTRYIMNNGWDTYHQLYNTCKLSTEFFTGLRGLKQLVRWSRNTWRSDITVLFVEGKIWKTHPFTSFLLLDKMLTPFFMLYGLIYLPISLIYYEKYVLFISWVAWLLVTRALKLSYYLWEHPVRIVYIPLFVVYQWIQMFLKFYALFTLSNRTWGTRGVKVVNNQFVRKGEEDEDVEKGEKKAQTTNPVIPPGVMVNGGYDSDDSDIVDGPNFHEDDKKGIDEVVDYNEDYLAHYRGDSE
jgi:glycosyltransferase involved in cell wall biosynthesis